MNHRPKIGIALSGASGRAIAHIGVLEVLVENKIPIDYIVGCSSGALIAASYATGTMEELKDLFYNLTVTKVLKLWSVRNAKGGIFHLDKEQAEKEMNVFTKNLNFEDIAYPKLGFTTTDLDTGELVTISSGSLNQAFKASVAIPGLLQPVVIDGRILVDGGLSNIVPTIPAKELGADIVIGVNLAASKFIYEKKLPIWRGYKFFTRLMGLQFIRESVIPKLSPRLLFRIDSQADLVDEQTIKIPSVFSVLAKALDWGVKFSDQWNELHRACDIMIEPGVKHYGKVEFNQIEKIYKEGRAAAQAAIPQIKKLIENYQPSKSDLRHEYQTS